MAYKKNEKTIAADVPGEVFEAFEEQRQQRGQVKKQALSSAIRLWVSLPEDIQARLLNKALKETAFIELIHEIVDQRIADGVRDGLSKLPKQKPSSKG